MPQAISPEFSTLIQASAATEPVLLLVKIIHPAASPVRLVVDSDDLVSNGETYAACGLDIKLPDDTDRTSPTVRLRVDGAGRAVNDLVDRTRGALGAKFYLSTVVRSNPNVTEGANYALEVISVALAAGAAEFTLGYKNIADKPSCQILYRASGFPGLFVP